MQPDRHDPSYAGLNSPAEADPTTEFVQYFTREYQQIFAYVFSLVGNRADAEDILQRTGVVLWQKFGEFDRDRNFFAWACGVAFYVTRNFLRVAGRDRLRFSDGLLSTIADERAQIAGQSHRRADALDECLQKLDPKDRELLLDAYSDETTIKDLAGRLGRAVQTVYNRLNHLRRGLGDCIDRRLLREEGVGG